MSDLTLGYLAIGLMLAFIVLGMHIGIALIVMIGTGHLLPM